MTKTNLYKQICLYPYLTNFIFEWLLHLFLIIAIYINSEFKFKFKFNLFDCTIMFYTAKLTIIVIDCTYTEN